MQHKHRELMVTKMMWKLFWIVVILIELQSVLKMC